MQGVVRRHTEGFTLRDNAIGAPNSTQKKNEGELQRCVGVGAPRTCVLRRGGGVLGRGDDGWGRCRANGGGQGVARRQETSGRFASAGAGTCGQEGARKGECRQEKRESRKQEAAGRGGGRWRSGGDGGRLLRGGGANVCDRPHKYWTNCDSGSVRAVRV